MSGAVGAATYWAMRDLPRGAAIVSALLLAAVALAALVWHLVTLRRARTKARREWLEHGAARDVHRAEQLAAKIRARYSFRPSKVSDLADGELLAASDGSLYSEDLAGQIRRV